jgi:hypothetical protein
VTRIEGCPAIASPRAARNPRPPQTSHFAPTLQPARRASDTFATCCARSGSGGKFALNRAQFNSKIGSKILLLNLLLKSTAKPEN